MRPILLRPLRAPMPNWSGAGMIAPAKQPSLFWCRKLRRRLSGCGNWRLKAVMLSMPRYQALVENQARFQLCTPYGRLRSSANGANKLSTIKSRHMPIPNRNADEYWNAVSFPLTQGYWTVIDADDYAAVSRRSWHVKVKASGKKYARTYFISKGRQTTRYMHQILLGKKRGSHIDHRNNDGLDNRRANLRFCTRAQNNQNRPKTTSKRSSKFKGVYFNKELNNWRAYIFVDNRSIYLGAYTSESDAATAYNIEARRLHGIFARLNDINPQEEPA